MPAGMMAAAGDRDWLDGDVPERARGGVLRRGRFDADLLAAAAALAVDRESEDMSGLP